MNILHSNENSSLRSDNQSQKMKALAPQRAIKKASAPARSVLGERTNMNNKELEKSKKNLPKMVKQSTEISVKKELTEANSLNKVVNGFEELTFGVENIDRLDFGNPQLCPEYANDIYQYMLSLEYENPVCKDYMSGGSLKPKMRSILVDWLAQVHQRFDLMQETLYLTVAILDLYLQKKSVAKSKLQLTGVSAMHIAAKYEEMYAPELADYVYISDNSVTTKDIITTESDILKTIDFKLGRPLPLHFLRRNSKAGNVEPSHHFLAKYLLELSIVDYNMVHVLPSKIAAAALCLSLKLIDDQPWNSTLKHYSRYSEESLRDVICHLAKNLLTGPENCYQKVIVKKFSSAKMLKIAEHSNLTLKREYLKKLCEEADEHSL